MRILGVIFLVIAAASTNAMVFVAMPMIAEEWSINLSDLTRQLIERFAIGTIVGLLLGVLAPRLLNATGALILPALLAVSAVLCGLSATAEMLGWFRFAAGLFSGMLTTYCFIVVALTYQRELRAIFLGLILAITVAVSGFGPFLGVRLADGYGWRWTLHATAFACVTAIALVLAGWRSWTSARLGAGEADPIEADWGRPQNKG